MGDALEQPELSWLERILHTDEVGGSSPLSPTSTLRQPAPRRAVVFIIPFRPSRAAGTIIPARRKPIFPMGKAPPIHRQPEQPDR